MEGTQAASMGKVRRIGRQNPDGHAGLDPPDKVPLGASAGLISAFAAVWRSVPVVGNRSDWDRFRGAQQYEFDRSGLC
jgi:hypothetical protein